MKNTSLLATASCLLIAILILTTARGDQNPKQLITKESWDLIGWSDKGEITKDMERLPTIHFKNGDRVVGNVGMNSFGGNYRATTDGSMKFHEISITEKGGPNEMERTYMKLLWECTKWSIVNDTLILSDGTENNQFRYKTGIRKIDRPLKHQEWRLVGVQVINENGMTLTRLGEGAISFKIGDGNKILGSTGVNSYSAQAELGEENKITIGPTRMTMRGAEPKRMAAEKEYIGLLGTIAQWEISGRQLTLSDEKKSFGLVFETE